MAEEQDQEGFVTIDGKDYPMSSLSDELKSQLQSYRVAEQEISRLKGQLALAQTALDTYRKGIQDNLPSDT